LTTRPQSAYAAEEFSPCVFDEIVTRRLVKAAAGIAPAIKPIGRKRPADQSVNHGIYPSSCCTRPKSRIPL